MSRLVDHSVGAVAAAETAWVVTAAGEAKPADERVCPAVDDAAAAAAASIVDVAQMVVALRGSTAIARCAGRVEIESPSASTSSSFEAQQGQPR